MLQGLFTIFAINGCPGSGGAYIRLAKARFLLDGGPIATFFNNRTSAAFELLCALRLKNVATEDVLHMCVSLALVDLVLLAILLQLRIDVVTGGLYAYVLLRTWYVVLTQLRGHTLRCVDGQSSLLELFGILIIVDVRVWRSYKVRTQVLLLGVLAVVLVIDSKIESCVHLLT